MKKICLCGLLFAIFTVTPAMATTLGWLITDDHSLTVGDKVFENWSVDNSDFDQSSYNNIILTGDNADPFNPGIIYNTTDLLFLNESGQAELKFSFDVRTISGQALIKDNSLEITGARFSDVQGGSQIKITEEVSGAGDLITKEVYAYADGTYSLPAYREFDPVNSLSISNYILFDIDCVPDGWCSASLDGFQQHFSQQNPIPEPATMLLFGTGIAGLVGARFRRKK